MADAIEILTLLAACLAMSLTPDGPANNAAYKAIAFDIGLRGSRAEPHCAPVLRDRLIAISQELGPIPHDKLDIGTKAVGAAPKQATRMLAALCPACGARIRLAHATTLSAGLPICSKDRVAFVLEAKDARAADNRAAGVKEEARAASAVGGSAPEASAPAVAEAPDAPWEARFSKQPPATVTTAIKGLGGRWNPEAKLWSGTENGPQVEALVNQAGGAFESKDAAAPAQVAA